MDKPLLPVAKTIVEEKSFLSKIIIGCDNTYKSYFDALILFLVGYSCIMSLYNSAFTASDNTILFVWDWIVEAFFYTDLVLNFFHAYRDPETQNPVEDLGKISKNYLYGWFMVDFLAVFPF